MDHAGEHFNQSTRFGDVLRVAAVAFAFLGGIAASAVGLMSVVSIVGRSTMGLPVTGDFELVEIGIAVAGSSFLPFCQAARGQIAVDFFTLKAKPRTIYLLDRFGDLLMAITLLVIAWRAGVGAHSIWLSGETSMLLGFPIWIGYAAVVPGVILAGLIALAQFGGLKIEISGSAEYEQ